MHRKWYRFHCGETSNRKIFQFFFHSRSFQSQFNFHEHTFQASNIIFVFRHMDSSFLSSDLRFFQSVVLLVATFVISLFGSVITSNYSQTDKLWSITPVLFSAIWVFSPLSSHGMCSYLMFFYVFVWGSRLTANFFIRGGYKWPPWLGEEDYRWKIVQKWPVFSYNDHGHMRLRWTWHFFNLFYISGYLNFLLLALVFPIIYMEVIDSALHANLNDRLNLIKSVFLLFVGLTFIAIEGVADHHKTSFQRDKTLGKVNGFLEKGLFKYSRHPNYASEQMIWVVLYLFTVDINTLSNIFNWSVIGCLLNIQLFYQSTKLTEQISIDRYGKSYLDYQKKTPKFVPSIFRND